MFESDKELTKMLLRDHAEWMFDSNGDTEIASHNNH